MNERIQKLAELAGAEFYTGFLGSPNSVKFTEDEFEKFAELIVRECASIFEGIYTDQQRPQRIDTVIKKHFGVE